MTIKCKKRILLSVLAACVGFTAQLNARTNQTATVTPGKEDRQAALAAKQTGSLNVRDFGATGDGITDDTDAIQRSLIQAASRDYPALTPPEVFFPPGNYRISRTLLVPCYRNRSNKSYYNFINLRGEQATITQTSPTEDVLYFQRSFRNLIEGLTFDGGKRQIKLWSQNLDSAHIIIRDCVFKNAAGCAIDDQLRLDPASETKNWYNNVIEPYTISTNEDGLPELTPIDEEVLPMCVFVSTLMRISRCSFVRCQQVLSTWADWAFMHACTIETHPDMDGPAILVGGCLIMDDIQGMGHATPGKKQWWVSMDPRKLPSGIITVDMRNVRLETDTRDGWWAIRNETKFAGSSQVTILIDGCAFQSAGSEQNCVLYMEEVPNLINVRNCRETSGRDVNILGFAKSLDEDYFHFQSPEKFSFVIDENNRGMLPNMPEVMAQFEDPPLPQEVARLFERPPALVTLPAMREGIVRHLNILDFGANRDGRTDDSEAFRQAFAASQQQTGLTEVQIPNGIYQLDTSVELPPRIVIRGIGHARFTAPSEMDDATFTIDDAKHVLIQNLDFSNCEHALGIKTKVDTQSQILIDNCSFNDSRSWAITCLSGNGHIAEANQTSLRISDCTFRRSRVLMHNVTDALMDNAWITTDPNTLNSGAVQNKGTLHIKSLLGVPRAAANLPDAKGHDDRWVDNYHRLLLDGCRFGGESGGLPMVVNFATQGEVLLQNGWTGIRDGNPKRVTIVDCEQLPDKIALRGNRGSPSPQMMVTIRAGAHGKLKNRFFESGNTAPPWIRDERNGKAEKAEPNH